MSIGAFSQSTTRILLLNNPCSLSAITSSPGVAKLLSPKEYLPRVNRAEMWSKNLAEKVVNVCQTKASIAVVSMKRLVSTADRNQHKNTHMAFLGDPQCWNVPANAPGKWASISSPTKSDHWLPQTWAESLRPQSSKQRRPEVTKLRPDKYLCCSSTTASSKNHHFTSPPGVVIVPLQPRTQDGPLVTKNSVVFL